MDHFNSNTLILESACPVVTYHCLFSPCRGCEPRGLPGTYFSLLGVLYYHKRLSYNKGDFELGSTVTISLRSSEFIWLLWWEGRMTAWYPYLEKNVIISADAFSLTVEKHLKKQITSPGWMHETSARAWCTGKTQRDWVERQVEGEMGMGNTCKSMADSCQCMTKPTTIL